MCLCLNGPHIVSTRTETDSTKFYSKELTRRIGQLNIFIPSHYQALIIFVFTSLNIGSWNNYSNVILSKNKGNRSLTKVYSTTNKTNGQRYQQKMKLEIHFQIFSYNLRAQRIIATNVSDRILCT